MVGTGRYADGAVFTVCPLKKHLKLLKRDEIRRGRKAQHSGKSASESNIITAVHQIYICMLELIGTRFLMEKRLFYPSGD